MQKNKNVNLKPKTWVEISSAALKNNIGIFERAVGKKTQIMAVVKANAYGHGTEQVAEIAQRAGVRWFGVDAVQDGVNLRKAGIRGSILVMGYTPPENLLTAVENDLSFVAYGKEIVSELARLSRAGKLKNKQAKVHLKIETGTLRQGLYGKDLLAYAKKMSSVAGVKIQGAYTHFANIEDTTEHTFAASQIKRFKDECDALVKIGVKPELRHTACSAAAILFPQTYFDLIRLGIAMYGLWPSKETKAVAQRSRRNNLDLKPVLSWKSIIAQIKTAPKGAGIGYGLSGHATRQTKIAILPIGYWDGYDRKLSNVANVLVRGSHCKILGRICMNMCMVDVTDVKGAKVGDEVVLLGRQSRENISAEDLAAKVGTINYEIVTRINPLIPRIVVR